MSSPLQIIIITMKTNISRFNNDKISSELEESLNTYNENKIKKLIDESKDKEGIKKELCNKIFNCILPFYEFNPLYKKKLEFIIKILPLVKNYTLFITYHEEFIAIYNYEILRGFISYPEYLPIFHEHETQSRQNKFIFGLNYNEYFAKYLYYYNNYYKYKDLSLIYVKKRPDIYYKYIELYNYDLDFFFFIVASLFNSIMNKINPTLPAIKLLRDLLKLNKHINNENKLLYNIDFSYDVNNCEGAIHINYTKKKTLKYLLDNKYTKKILVEKFRHLFGFPGELRATWISLIARISYM